MIDKIIIYVAEEISYIKSIDINEANNIVLHSFFPKLLNKIPDYVEHYDSKYWAQEILDESRIYK